tara:strand:- start:145206 stop:145373 length:168 start_codon:yes stop_codon:yes gene_type:complete
MEIRERRETDPQGWVHPGEALGTRLIFKLSSSGDTLPEKAIVVPIVEGFDHSLIA